MRRELELAYLGVEVPDPSSLDGFLGDVIGLVPGASAPGGTVTWRNDAKAHRLIVRPGPANDAAFVGLEAADAAAFDTVRTRLTEAGYDVEDGSGELCAERSVQRLARTTSPWGVPFELVLGLADASTPFASPLVPGGFLTAGVGFGHAVFVTPAFEEAHRFLVEGLGLAQSDWLEMEIAAGIELEVRFYHCNPRHHTLALAKAPFELPQRLHHVMFETNERDDVGAAFDRVWAADLAITNGLGRHDNDGMFSFYVASPAGFQVEVGHGARTITEPWDDNRRYDRISVWGHQPLPRELSAMPEIDADVAIVGCGPVGNTLAILLAQLGRNVVVLERWPRPYPLPRAVHFDHEVGRIFQSCGIGPALRAISEPADTYEWRNGTGATLLRFGRRGDGPSGWPTSSMFHQPALEALLDQRASELSSITVRRGLEVTGLEQLDDAVVVSAADGTRLRTRYVVGCDGANSAVRSLAGMPLHDLGFFFDWLIVDVILDEPRVFDPLNLQVCDPTRPTTAVSGGPGRRRWEFMRLPHESLAELNDEGRAWELLAPWDVHPGNARLERHAVYTFNACYAEQWRTGRVLLAGDAAHLMPPFAGQGMCAGIRDASNLAWKLELVLAGHAPDALLDTYQQERLPSARQAIELSMELGNVICVADPEQAAARDEAMAAAVGPEPIDVPDLPGPEHGLVHASAPHAGHLFVQGTVDGQAFDDVHGAGWRLVTIDLDSGAIDADLRVWFAAIGGRVVALDDPDAVHRQWFAARDTRWALQRPDFHLYGAAETAGDASRLLTDLRDHLNQPDPALVGGTLT